MSQEPGGGPLAGSRRAKGPDGGLAAMSMMAAGTVCLGLIGVGALGTAAVTGFGHNLAPNPAVTITAAPAPTGSGSPSPSASPSVASSPSGTESPSSSSSPSSSATTSPGSTGSATPSSSSSPTATAGQEPSAQPTTPDKPGVEPSAPAPTSTPAPPSGANGCVTTWIVKPGDTLSGISGTTGVSLERIAKVNKIKNVNLIYDGAALCIPPAMG